MKHDHHVHAWHLGLTLGILSCVSVFLVLVLNGTYGWWGMVASIIADSYPWAGSSGAGLFWGFVWAFLDGLVGGFLLAWIYNWLAKRK